MSQKRLIHKHRICAPSLHQRIALSLRQRCALPLWQSCAPFFFFFPEGCDMRWHTVLKTFPLKLNQNSPIPKIAAVVMKTCWTSHFGFILPLRADI